MCSRRARIGIEQEARRAAGLVWKYTDQLLISRSRVRVRDLTELTHRRPRTWIPAVERLHDLLQTHGDAAIRTAFERGLAEQTIGAEYIAHYLSGTVPPLPFEESGPASDAKRPVADAAEHGGIVSARRRPIMMPATDDLDGLFKRLSMKEDSDQQADLARISGTHSLETQTNS